MVSGSNAQSVDFQDHKVVDQIEGADAAALTEKVTKHFGSGASIKGAIAPSSTARLASNSTASTSAVTDSVSGTQLTQQELGSRLEQLVHSAPVMLFMKGDPAQPRCGFSAKVVEALQQAGVEFKHFDILSDDAVRQGLKVGCYLRSSSSLPDAQNQHKQASKLSHCMHLNAQLQLLYQTATH